MRIRGLKMLVFRKILRRYLWIAQSGELNPLAWLHFFELYINRFMLHNTI